MGLQETPTLNRLLVFPPVLTVLEPTPSSTHTTPATSLAMSSLSNLLLDLSSNNSNSPASTTTTITTTSTPHRVQADSFLQENLTSIDLKLDSILTLSHSLSPPQHILVISL